MYEVFLERRAERDLKKISEEMFYRVIPQLKALSENPKPSGCRKITGSKNYWRIRISHADARRPFGAGSGGPVY